MNKETDIKIREVREEDSESIAALTEELGYYETNEEIKNKINKFSKNLSEKIFVAEYESVIGWMHISYVEPLESKPFVEIKGIVIKREYRNNGIGTKLIHKAEVWAKDSGCKKIRVRTNIKRAETIKYYKNLKFVSLKTQEVFEKEI